MMHGNRIGPYEIVEPLGTGGMGEVYRVHDPTLRRDVAIKFLPPEFAADAERLGRLEDEARTLASLNHPGIATVHGFEQHDGMAVIVMELVGGLTLAEKLEGGSLPLEEAAEVGADVARALAAAHAQGVIHRDMKPANVKITPEGRTKVLDFGLAKALSSNPRDVSDSKLPTVARQPTRAGLVMGTVPYMSPEQARGLPLDRETDIWSFGCVLYEMLAGTPAFSGNTTADVVADILRAEPDWRALPRDTPPKVTWLLRRCLAKDAGQRLSDIGEAGDVLDAIVRGEARPWRVVTTAARDAWSRWAGGTAKALAGFRQAPAAFLGLVAVSILALILIAFAVGRTLGGRSDPAGAWQPRSFAQLTSLRGEALYPDLSPDGQFVVYSSRASGNWDIYLQRVGGGNSINLTVDSPADDTQPAYSADGRFVAFRSERGGGGLFVMEATGENVRRVTDEGYHPDWSPDGSRLVYSTASVAEDPLMRGQIPSALRIVPIAGGAYRELVTGDAVQPVWSPGGGRIAYWGVHRGGQRDIWTISVVAGEAAQVTDDEGVDWNPAWAPDGAHLYFVSDRGGSMNLWRVSTDEASGRVRGVPQPVTTPSAYSQHVRLGAGGTALVYVQARRHVTLELISFDPDRGAVTGRPEPVSLGSHMARNPDLSPGGEWFVFDSPALGSRQEDLFVAASEGSSLQRLTSDAYKDRGGRWSPDGSRIAFLSDRSGRYECWVVNPDGSGLHQVSDTSDTRWAQAPIWAPDGTSLACNMSAGSPIILDPSGDGPTSPLQALPPPPPGTGSLFFAWSWSPDGGQLAGWLESGIFTYSFDRAEFQQRTDFGERPRWLPGADRLLFQTVDIHLLDLATGATRTVYSPAPNRVQSFGISGDGRRLYVAVQVNEADVWIASLQ